MTSQLRIAVRTLGRHRGFTILFALVAAWLFAGATAAALIPAWRATRTDPVVALRHE